MEEINKKRIVKSRSYGEALPLIPKGIILLNKETDVKNSTTSCNKISVHNFRKYTIQNLQNRNNQLITNTNDSLLKTIATKNQTDYLEISRKNKENQNSDINITKNNEHSSKYKTLYRNKTQARFYTMRPSNKYIKNFRDSKDNQDDNIFNLYYNSDLNKSIKIRKTDNLNSSIENIFNNENNLESKENTENLFNIIDLNPFQKTISKNGGKTLLKLNTKRKKKKDKIQAFLLKSKKEKTSANDIIIHYLKENQKDSTKNIPLSNFKKYLETIDYRKFNYGLNKIYGNTDKFLRRIEEIKKNNVIAYKKDFNIENYQNTLLKVLKKRVSEKNYFKLQASFKKFNERNFGMFEPKGRFVVLAEKLKDFLSREIYENMKRADRNYLLYLGKKEEQMHQSEIESKNKEIFYKKLNKTLRVFNKKLRRNKSY